MRGYLFAWSGVEFFQRSALSILLVLTVLTIQPTPPAASDNVLAPALCVSALTFGVTMECSITLAGEIDAFTFTGAAGDRIRVRVIETSGALSTFHEIVRPNGVSLCSTVTGELTCLLDSAGIHTILVRDFSGPDTGNYALYIQRLNSPVGCTLAELGALPLSDTIGEAATNDCFIFPLAAGDMVRGRVVETAGSTSAYQEIVRPNGSTLCGAIGIETTCLADTTGTFTLLVKDFGGANTLSYNVYIQRLTNPPRCLPLPFGGSPLNGILNVPAETDCFVFSGLANANVRVRAVEITSGFSAFIEVVRPDGTNLCGTIGIEITCELNIGGSYTILIKDFNGANTGEYELSLVCLTSPCNPLQLPNIAYLPLTTR